MAGFAQTITVVNKSGKVMSTSKHIVNVFKEAQSAYRERKAELKAAREGVPKPPRKQDRHDDTRSAASSPSRRQSSARHTQTHRPHQSSHKPSSKRQHDFVRRRGSDSDLRPHSHARPQPSGTKDSRPTGAPSSRTPRRATTMPIPEYCQEPDNRGKELVRRRSDLDALAYSSHPKPFFADDIDMDLAYGELPPSFPPPARVDTDQLRGKMTALERMLEEANCLQYSATAIIKNLETNPDAMAAVALTLAEISNLAAKAAPGALASLGKATPAVMALLLSPEFLIAVGVGVGITVVTLGGYKIIKRLKARKTMKVEGSPKGAGSQVTTSSSEMTEEEAQKEETLDELPVDLNHIERWRRGVSDVASVSVATSVDGEFITPGAAARLRDDPKLPVVSTAAIEERKKKKSSKHEQAKKEGRRKSDGDAKDQRKKEKKTKDVAKEPSKFRLMFKREAPGIDYL